MFGTVDAPDMTGAVVGRLKAAIALGVLEDGDLLPPEVELVRQFGVTTFALRGALASLREEELIVTRPGRGGGSFVHKVPEIGGTLARQRLLGLSAHDLFDLGKWRSMLAGASAALAAERASSANIERLRLDATSLLRADSSDVARRHHGRFHVELAAAAQSTRMSAAEFRMHEEFDWLFGLVLEDGEARRASGNDLAAIVSAVESQQVTPARDAAEEHARSTVDDLVRIRMALIAGTTELSHGAAPDLVACEIADEVGRLLAHMVAVGDELASSTAERWAGSRPTDASFAVTSEILRAFLASTELPIVGLSTLTERGVLPNDYLRNDGWVRGAGGITQSRHAMDPRRDDYYDYLDREYMANPREQGSACITGPFVDYGGTNDYTITVSSPIMHDSQFLGIVALDLLVSQFERGLAKTLARSMTPCAVVNEDSRVVVSNSVAFAGTALVDRGTVDISVPCGDSGWSVLVREA